jgi:hypothetical protein
LEKDMAYSLGKRNGKLEKRTVMGVASERAKSRHGHGREGLYEGRYEEICQTYCEQLRDERWIPQVQQYKHK